MMVVLISFGLLGVMVFLHLPALFRYTVVLHGRDSPLILLLISHPTHVIYIVETNLDRSR